MKINRIALTMTLVGLLGLAGCAKYKAKSLCKLNASSHHRTEEQSVTMSYHVFSKADCKRYLDRDVLRKGYQPIHITLTNNSDRYLDVSLENFSLPCVPADQVARKVHTNTTGRAVGYGVAGLFIWPFLIPAIVDGIGSAKANEQLDEDFNQKTVRSQLLKPYSSINGLIFVPRHSFSENFTFTVIDTNSREPLTLDSTQLYAKF